MGLRWSDLTEFMVGILAPLIPYLAVLTGIYWLRSVWVAAIGYHLGTVILLWICRKQPVQVSATRTSIRLMGLVLAMGFLTGIAVYLVIPLTGMPPNTGTRLHALGLTSWPVFMLYYCTANPILEELLWRWKLGSASALPTRNDLLFAGYHLLVLAPFLHGTWLIVVFVLVSLAGWAWRQCVGLRGGLAAAIVSHILADIGIVLVASRMFPV